jgi:hypothetical protein
MEQTAAKTRGETRKADIGNWKIENRNSKFETRKPLDTPDGVFLSLED